MKVSVVIPIYEVKPYLERCVNSVLIQTFKDLEIILVDDGSTDGSGELADKLALVDSRVHVIHQKNQGLSVARNEGLHASTGEYIIFLDSDDEWLMPDGIETMLNESMPGTDLIVFKRVDYWKQGNRKESADYDIDAISKLPDGAAIFSHLIKTQKFQISACFLMSRRKILIENEIFFPIGFADEDISWNLKLWQFAHTVSFHNLPFYGYHHRADSLTTTSSINIFHSNDRIFTNWEALCFNKCTNSVSILSFLANNWVSLGYRYHMITKSDRPIAISILKRHKNLLHYATTPKTHRTALLVKMIGVSKTCVILGFYWRIRKFFTGNIV